MTFTTMKVVFLVLITLNMVISTKSISENILGSEAKRESIARRSGDGLTWNLVRILVDEQRERQNLRKEFRDIKKTLDNVKRELEQKNVNLADIKFQRKKLLEEVKNTKKDLKTELEKYLTEKYVIIDGKLTKISKTIAKMEKDVAGIHTKDIEIEARIVQNAKHDTKIKKQLNIMRAKVDTLEIEGSMKRPGAVYIRWGRLTCPNNTDLVYTGRLGGTHYSHKAGPSNYQCLPDDPDYKEHQSGNQGTYIYGGEYELSGYSQRELLHKSYHNYDVLCSVCQSRQHTTQIMIPGKSKCYGGWHMQYRGYLMSGHYGHASSNYICVDANPDVVRGSNVNTDHALIYAVQSMCGGLKCPPYKDYYELTCVVCTK